MSIHLRGYVRIVGHIPIADRRRFRSPGRITFARATRPVYGWGVVNESTGEVVASDNACQDSLGDAVDEARRLVELCRVAWRIGIASKALREAK